MESEVCWIQVRLEGGGAPLVTWHWFRKSIHLVFFCHVLLAIRAGCTIQQKKKIPFSVLVEKLHQVTYATWPGLHVSTLTDGDAFLHSTLHFHLFTSARKSFAFRISNSHQVRCIAIATSTTQSTLDHDLDCAVILFSRPRMDWDEELQQFSINCPDVSTLI